MKSSSLKSLVCVGLLSASSAWALPTLQLDIVGGVYDPIQQTTVAQSTVYTLQALLLKGTANASATYFVSAAIIPKNGSSWPSPGAPSPGFDPIGFSSGITALPTTYYSSTQFTYGTPPLDSLYPDLPSHGVFPTYYLEFAFTFSSDPLIPGYNVQDGSSAGSQQLYVHSFTVDTTSLLNQLKLSQGQLLDNYDLHFDLYNETVKQKKNTVKYGIDFAPFSHDAQSWYSTPDGGSTLLLIGAALIGLFGLRRRMRQ